MCVLTLVNNNWVTSRTFSKPRYDISLHCTAPTLTPFSSSTSNSKSLTNKNDNQGFKTELEEFLRHWMATILITSNLTKRLGKSRPNKGKIRKILTCSLWSLAGNFSRLPLTTRMCSLDFPALATSYACSFQFGLVHWPFPRLTTGNSYLPLVLLGWLDNPSFRDIFIILKL